MKVDDRVIADVTAYVKAAVDICKDKNIDPNSPMAGEIFELIAKRSAPATNK